MRRGPWRGSHLRTFKFKLWKLLKDSDLRGSDGKFYDCAWDLEFMWPMLEMAGYHRTKWISERIYVYNQETAFNDAKLYLKEQMFLTNYMAAMPPYPYVEDV